MNKVKIMKFTVPQRDGENPPVKVTVRRYQPLTKRKLKQTKLKKQIDYGVTEEQYYDILKKAAQPIGKPETD